MTCHIVAVGRLVSAVLSVVTALTALVRSLPASEGVVYHLVAAAVIWLMATGIHHAGRNIRGNIR